MLRKIFTSYFWVTWLAVTFAAGLVWLDHYRGYEAETAIFIGETANSQNAGATLSTLLGTLNFYDAVLTRNDVLDDPFAEEAPEERKSGWQSIVSLSRVDTSGVYALHAFAPDRAEANTLARNTIDTLFETAGRYYDVKNDLDLRIADGPLVAATVHEIPQYLLVSAGSGFGVTFLFFAILISLERLLGGDVPREKRRENDGEMRISADTFRPSVPTHWDMPAATSYRDESAAPEKWEDLPASMKVERGLADHTPATIETDEEYLPFEEEDVAEEVSAFEENIPETFSPSEEEYREETLPRESMEMPEEKNVHVRSLPTAAAPANLPVLETEDFDEEPAPGTMRTMHEDLHGAELPPLLRAQANLTKKDINVTARERATEPEGAEERGTMTHEPTEEDYRRRLNALLSGKMK